MGGRGWLFPGLTLEVNVSGSGSWPQEPCTWTTGWFCGVDGSVDFSGVTKKTSLFGDAEYGMHVNVDKRAMTHSQPLHTCIIQTSDADTLVFWPPTLTYLPLPQRLIYISIHPL